MLPHLKDFIFSFLNDIGVAGEGFDIRQVPGDGSSRIFRRVTLNRSDHSFIVMSNTPVDTPSRRENLAYLKIGKHLHQKGVSVPEIYSFNLDHGWFIMEDFGPTNLQEALSGSKDLSMIIYEKVLEHLIRLQIEGAKGFDPAWCCQTKSYDRYVMRRYESDYFRDAFLRIYLGFEREWAGLDKTFNYLVGIASEADGSFLLHRDFQSRNILITNGDIGIVDWQGARFGPLAYDLASLVIDPYTDLSAQDRMQVYDGYLLLLREHNSKLVSTFERYYPYLAIQRNLQILGAFSYLTKVKNKKYFESYIPPALRTLQDLLHQVDDFRLLPLRRLINSIRL
jgi:aminoglycoside/choline kinase family phosphotransferase